MTLRNIFHPSSIAPNLRSFAPWVILGLAVHIAGFVLLRIEIAPATEVEAIPPFVTWVAADAREDLVLFQEQSLFMDTAVLFVPRQSPLDDVNWNTPERGYALRFAAIEPNIQLDTSAPLSLSAFNRDGLVTQPKDLLATRFWRLFNRIGFADLPVAASESLSSSGFQIMHWQGDASVEFPDPSSLPDYEYRRGRLLDAPADMVLHLDERGVLGRPVRLSNPGNREFLDQVHVWLKNPTLHYPLTPGSYSTRIFP